MLKVALGHALVGRVAFHLWCVGEASGDPAEGNKLCQGYFCSDIGWWWGIFLKKGSFKHGTICLKMDGGNGVSTVPLIRHPTNTPWCVAGTLTSEIMWIPYVFLGRTSLILSLEANYNASRTARKSTSAKNRQQQKKSHLVHKNVLFTHAIRLLHGVTFLSIVYHPLVPGMSEPSHAIPFLCCPRNVTGPC